MSPANLSLPQSCLLSLPDLEVEMTWVFPSSILDLPLLTQGHDVIKFSIDAIYGFSCLFPKITQGEFTVIGLN